MEPIPSRPSVESFQDTEAGIEEARTSRARQSLEQLAAVQDSDSSRPIHIPTSLQQSSVNKFTVNKKRARFWSKHFRFNASDLALQWWLWELLACSASLAALIAIIVFLSIYGNRSQPQWPTYITINTILSILAAVLKAPLLLSIAACIGQAKWTHYRTKPRPLADYTVYDDASRGPWGALQLLWTLRGKHIASIGAILTILSIGVDPTVQLMVTLQSKEINSTQPATIGIAHSFSSYVNPELQGPRPLIALPTLAMLAAVYSGFYYIENGNGISLDMNSNCPTTNCTYPTFRSLAACSACQDITSAVKVASHIDYHTLSLPNGLKANVSEMEVSNRRFVSSGYLPLVVETTYGNSFLNFSSIRPAGYVPDPVSNAFVFTNYTAKQCSLYWCINTYQAQVVNGTIDEQLKDSWHDNQTRWSESEFPEKRWAYLVHPAEEGVSPASNFSVAYMANAGISDWLSDKLTLSNSIAIVHGASNWTFDITQNASSASSDMIVSFRDADLSARFQSIAKSITRHIRNLNSTIGGSMAWSDDPGSRLLLDRATRTLEFANGTSSYSEIYVVVRWPWLTLSALLVVTAIFLLILTVIDTAQHDMVAWKTSSLPILWQALGEGPGYARSSATSSTIISDLENLASNVYISLKDHEDEILLVKHCDT